VSKIVGADVPSALHDASIRADAAPQAASSPNPTQRFWLEGEVMVTTS